MKKKIVWIIYIIVIIFVIIYFSKIAPNYSKKNIDAEAPFGLYEDMITMIKRDNYIFDYDITTTNIKIKYYGKKDGQKEQSVVYYNEEVGDIESLKDLINLDLINPNYIFDILEDSNEYNLNKEIDKRTFTYDIDLDSKMKIVIKTDLVSITNISIYTKEITYDLKYENIGFTTIN